jgi:hypothetical protein
MKDPIGRCGGSHPDDRRGSKDDEDSQWHPILSLPFVELRVGTG